MSEAAGWFPMRDRSLVAVGLAVLAGPPALLLLLWLDASAGRSLPLFPESIAVLSGLAALVLGALITYLAGERKKAFIAVGAVVGVVALFVSFYASLPLFLTVNGHDSLPDRGDAGGHDNIQTYHTTACWEEDGLFDAIANATSQPGLAVELEDAEGWPLDPASLPAAWGEARVEKIRWHLPSKANESHAKDRFLVTQTRNLTAGLTDDFTDEEKRAYFIEFAANVTRANQTTLEAWADRFMASEQPWDGRSSDTRTSWDPGFQRYEVHIGEGVLALGDVVANLSEPKDRFRTVGQAEIVDAPWYLTLDLPQKTIKASWSLGTRGEISVDPRDLAIYTYTSDVDFSQPWDRDGDPPPTPEAAFSQLRELGDLAPYDGPIRWDKDQVDPEPLRC